jgi:hypothetical protein
MEKTLSYYDWDQSFQKTNGDPLSVFTSQFSSLYAKKNWYKIASLSKEDFKFLELNLSSDHKKITCKCPTSEIEVNSEKKTISHKCVEFRDASKFYNHFCSHLIKMFIFLIELDSKRTKELLHDILTTDYWFISK